MMSKVKTWSIPTPGFLQRMRTMSRNHDSETETLDHGGPKLEVDGKAGTLDHGGPKLEVDGETETLDHDGPKLEAWGEAEMENKEKPFGAEINDKSTDKEQLPETGSCIFF